MYNVQVILAVMTFLIGTAMGGSFLGVLYIIAQEAKENAA